MATEAWRSLRSFLQLRSNANKQYLNLFRRHAVAQRHHHSRQLVGRDEPVVVLRSGKINGLRQAQC